jgi:diketogulonate reductase-like aldo/keto reductase
VLRWGVQRGYTVLPKSTKEERVKENFQLFDFALTEEEVDKISGN